MSMTTMTERVRPPVASKLEGPRDRCRLIERFAPGAQVRERHEITIDAPAEHVLQVAEDFDMLSIPAVRGIFWLRAKAMGARPAAPEERLGLVAGTRLIGWGELARRPGREVVMGAAVQPWLREPVFETVPAEDFVSYAEPDHVKIVWTLEAEPLDSGRTLLRTETRVVPTDDEARRKFRRYWLLARSGIVLIRRLVLPAVRREGERKAAAPESHELDRILPSYEAAIVCEARIDAPPALTYAAIRETNLLDPIVGALFAVRELPARASARLRGTSARAAARSITVTDFLRPGSGMTLVTERTGSHLVIGSVGRFWQRDYGHIDVNAGEFQDFAEPGYAKLAMGFEVRPLPGGGSALRYEARTATTDEDARRSFRRYWRVIRPGVWLVMKRAVALIRREAERRAAGLA